MISRTLIKNADGRAWLTTVAGDEGALGESSIELSPLALVGVRRVQDWPVGIFLLPEDTEIAKAEPLGLELFRRGPNGEKQDAALWDELLGDDDQDTRDVAELAGTGDSTHGVSKLDRIRDLLHRVFRA